ncbi:hypothetical protein SAMN06295998_102188 [Primorskyibacter flagellatus]|uniref:Uncharacterized protein n=1 Tax=Primorskyibacter flagellatus TaxID=1387277 RepID=A0A1W1ZVA3_9RHOB|nr:hypothetical protein SAMN06295998_102188 [Primorskyibacter flagellatus]
MTCDVRLRRHPTRHPANALGRQFDVNKGDGR